MSEMLPLVSVVIPTYLRPGLVGRAVHSALDQSLRSIEVIVVVDGRDAETSAVLQAITDHRLRIVVPSERRGNADARNLGVQHARASWIAFLDDDDEWLPLKLERQLATAQGSSLQEPVVTCRLIARTETGDFNWPRRLPRPREPLSEYFFCRRTPFTGEGMVINSGILASRRLLLQVPFRSGLERYVDPDWLMRATAGPGAGLEFVPDTDPLLVWHIEQDRARITTTRNWRASLSYANDNRGLFTPRSYAAFLLHVVGSAAAAQGDGRAFLPLLRQALAQGHPAAVDLVSHAGNFLLPFRLQRFLAAAFARATPRLRSAQ